MDSSNNQLLLEYSTHSLTDMRSDEEKLLYRVDEWAKNYRIMLKYQAQNKIPKGMYMQQTCKRGFSPTHSTKLAQIPWSVMEITQLTNRRPRKK